MKRNDVIRGISLASLGAVLPWGGNVKAGANELTARTTSCALISSETEGAYPPDTVSNSAILRQDIRENRSGIPLNLKLKVVDADTNLPIQNAWVKIWHCDKYKGYNNSQAFLRGVQITDANGEVEFITLFPGWLTGRVTHIHFCIYLSSVLIATSQITFAESNKSTIYASSSLCSSHGADQQALTIDNIFSEGYTLQMTRLTINTSTYGYNSGTQVGINRSDTPGLTNPEPGTGGQFKLEQNYPNPFVNETFIPLALTNASDVEVEIYDQAGRKVACIQRDNLAAGDHEFRVNLQSLGLASGTYIYQVVVTNDNGVFRLCKVMTPAK